MESLWQDIRYALRLLVEKPGVTAAALLTLAFGVGANTAIFSVVNGVLLRPLPYAEPENLVMVWQDHTRLDGPRTEWASPDNFFDWREQNEVFDGMFALGTWGPTLTGSGEPEVLNGAVVSHDAFSILGIEPLIGRDFRAEEDVAGTPLSVLLSYSLWQRRFSGDAQVLGTSITLDEEPATIVGVLPPDVDVPQIAKPAIVAPLRVDRSNSCGRGCVTLRVVARKKAGLSLESARSQMEAIGARLERDYPEENRGVGVHLVPLDEQIVGPIRPALLVLAASVVLVLLIACANVASLLLARAADREREVAARIALGASRTRLLRQFLTESLMLAVLGAGLGVVLALWGVDALRSVVADNVPRLSEVTVDGRVLGFTAVIALVTGLFFGLVPALRASRPELGSSLKEGSRGATSSRALRLRSVLVASEVALALAVLVGASLLVRSFGELVRVDPGFDPRNVLAASLNLASSRYEERESRVAFVARLLEGVRALPGVEGAGVVYALPMGFADADAGFRIEGRAPFEPNQNPVAWYRPASPGYFSTMKMKLVRGRWISDGDDAAATPVVLINETAVRRYWPSEDPLLSRVYIGGAWRRVVGVVGDTKHFGLTSEDRPAMYFPYAQLPLRSLGLVVRASVPPESLVPEVRSVVLEIDPELPLAAAAPLEETISDTVAAPRMTMALFSLFAALATGLCALGLYGVLSYAVGQQTREIGIRMALGARAEDVLRSTVGRGMVLLAVGGVLGLVLAAVFSRLLTSLLFGISPGDPTAFLSAFAALLFVSFWACYLPARRAARVQPVVALRYE